MDEMILEEMYYCCGKVTVNSYQVLRWVVGGDKNRTIPREKILRYCKIINLDFIYIYGCNFNQNKL